MGNLSGTFVISVFENKNFQDVDDNAILIEIMNAT